MKKRKEYTWIIAIVGIVGVLCFQLVLLEGLYQSEKERFEEKILEDIKQGIPKLNVNLGFIYTKSRNLISFESETRRLTILVEDKKYCYSLEEGITEKEIFERVYYDASNTKWKASHLGTLIQDSLRELYHAVPLKIIIRDSVGNSIDESGNLSVAKCKEISFGPVPLGYVTGRTLEAYYYFPFINFLYHEFDRILMTAVLFLLLVFFIGFLIHAVRVERENANAREEFMHIVLHNLQSPVDFVRRMSYEIKNRSVSEYTEEQEKLYTELKRRLDTMGQGIRRLLTHSVGVYGIHLEKSEINFPEMIVGIIRQYKSLSGKQIDMECDSSVSGFKADSVHLSGAIANLVENAVKYTAEECRIKITCRLHGKDIRITVADNGRGIPKKELRRIFRKYYQGTGAQKGFGLGLHYVWKVVKAHKGKMEVKSENGCEFIMVLPWNNQ
ncbi:sensor histidine kinase [Odoribacter lunatus]|uniref:sensor histidine kinase n=1 Tax=Odoribacter lunatus TaxID=2941335 RepID=UPI00203DC4FC|nr:HAMP domain-containing sensor histidine kinase [Odoribacter lunatus]